MSNKDVTDNVDSEDTETSAMKAWIKKMERDEQSEPPIAKGVPVADSPNTILDQTSVSGYPFPKPD